MEPCHQRNSPVRSCCMGRGLTARVKIGAVVKSARGLGMVLSNTTANGKKLVVDALLLAKAVGEKMKIPSRRDFDVGYAATRLTRLDNDGGSWVLPASSSSQIWVTMVIDFLYLFFFSICFQVCFIGMFAACDFNLGFFSLFPDLLGWDLCLLSLARSILIDLDFYGELAVVKKARSPEK